MKKFKPVITGAWVVVELVDSELHYEVFTSYVEAIDYVDNTTSKCLIVGHAVERRHVGVEDHT